METTGKYIGVPKTRYDFTLKLIKTQSTNRGFFVHTFEDRQQNQFICFADKEHIDIERLKLIEGDVFQCRATVNRHSINDFKVEIPIKQTVLNRVKYTKYLGNNDTNNTTISETPEEVST